MERLLSSVSRPRLASIRCIPQLTVLARTTHKLFNGSSDNYIESMYEQWSKDPKSVHKSWDLYFRNQNQQKISTPDLFLCSPGFSQYDKVINSSENQFPLSNQIQTDGSRKTLIKFNSKLVDDHVAVASLIRSFQVRGHKLAKLDPLEISTIDLDSERPTDLSYKFYRFTEADLDRTFFLPPGTYIGGEENQLPLREIIRRLENIYCQTVAVEYMHINSHEKCNWIRQRFEDPSKKVLEIQEIERAARRLIHASKFEEFLKKKWTTEKRFGLEGCEVLIPAMKMVIDTVASTGVDTVIMGMPHRGRLNVLSNVTKKALDEILRLFNEKIATDGEPETGDVKYHLGTYIERLYSATNSKIKFILLANPSHLEAVNPIVQGRTRAEQFYRNDKQGDKVMSILLHGDAAFAGQGVVFETFHLTHLPDYTTHGTVHIICNNQIGFTTDPRVARSSPYCTDVARVVNAPIFHVNADDVDSVLYVAKVAAEWRCKFKTDVVIDLVGYRRHGHNEADEPMFTQPHMYGKIKEQTPVLKKWIDKLLKSNIIKQEWYEAEVTKYEKFIDTAWTNSKNSAVVKIKSWIDAPWKGFFNKHGPFPYPKTGISEDKVKNIGIKAYEPPKDLNLHRGLKRIFDNRIKMLEERQIDWALAESMAIGSILDSGHHVRLSGQDVERGTFSHRHHVLHDQEKDLVTYIPLNNLHQTQGNYTICNSSLSEFAVLGFELGYSTSDPYSLVIWEAQFGDFANTAQCIIDQFISSGQAKWVRQSGIVLLLPHGYEGQGPEHSSARLERFLQMSAEDEDHVPEIKNSVYNDLSMYQLDQTNWIIANVTTPANFFHILRRQTALPFRKPLIIMSPKSLLRLPECRSSFDEIIDGTSFKRIYPEDGVASTNPDQVNKLIFCSGKTYYDLINTRTEEKLDSQISIVRIEQLCPFPFDSIRMELEKYKNAKVCFAQEEHKNMGSYSFCKPRLASVLREMNDKRANEINYAGRDAAAATATGLKSIDKSEKKKYMHEAMEI
ncbi:unnamed protein product [Adineta steineri]|uniref:2-oxoglutarate dehydrogenase complex component E1 n=1 Tax=Adineta steineri TaxID=433720 RepID=A0A819NVW2_9BILA|nr:unnamed protein product [Adineta steineri]CAF3999142.1 unnamed protein product [Adineta steineri]